MANRRRLKFDVDYRWLVAGLLFVLIGLVLWLRPWVHPVNPDRDISVTGEATIKAEPDEFVFYPSYEIKNNDSQAGLEELTKKSNDLIAGLKTLGVADEQIKTSSSNHERYAFPETIDGMPAYTLQLTVTVGSRALAQNVQDYLLTTSPSGQISPYPSFSDAKRKEMESQARDQATADARGKAEQLANNLGLEVGEVKTIEEQSGFGEVIPFDSALRTDSAEGSSLSVQPGENEINYTIRVVYYVE